MDPSRLEAMVQIGSTVFYLLFKTYNSKVYDIFLGKVVFITTHLAKLVSKFSDFSINFYEFYKLQAKLNRG
jgi:hypothetical protein